MGARYQGRCFDSAGDAAHAVWSGVAPVVSTGSPPVVSVVEFTGTAWQVATYQSGAVIAVEAVPTLAFSDCDPVHDVLEGAALGWLVVMVWAAAWAVHMMRRALT